MDKIINYVILGMVSILAVVGLVVLFSSASAFTVPAAKTYGGAIKGAKAPYSREFPGKAYEFPSGYDARYAAQWGGRAGVMIGGQAYGEKIGPRAVSRGSTYSRGLTEIPSWLTTCTQIAYLSNVPYLTEPADVNEALSYMAMGRKCARVDELRSLAYVVKKNELARSQGVFEYAKSLGVAFCCESKASDGQN
ncbi:hypothetical protein D6825_02840 [Candidatus Woesearchaeota archaeon]|nr:MAG: hypothetical protein D6825_02840 [Candidatus Woesearchaeota archaeon]